MGKCPPADEGCRRFWLGCSVVVAVLAPVVSDRIPVAQRDQRCDWLISSAHLQSSGPITEATNGRRFLDGFDCTLGPDRPTPHHSPSSLRGQQEPTARDDFSTSPCASPVSPWKGLLGPSGPAKSPKLLPTRRLSIQSLAPCDALCIWVPPGWPCGNGAVNSR